jgi:beta-glucanase (GH16 family)
MMCPGLDGKAYHAVTPASLPAGTKWVFNAPFFLLLNLAIGGPSTFLGQPDSSVRFPQDMLVDYVRVYQAATITAITPVITPGGVVNGAPYLGGSHRAAWRRCTAPVWPMLCTFR